MEPLARRTLLRSGLLATMTAVAGPALLTGCGSGEETSAPSNGTPRRGGTLRAAFTGAGAGETLNHFIGGTAMDMVRARALHATLGDLDPSAPDGVRYGVLETIEVDDELRAYTLRLRHGLTFSDGSALTARDVLWSLHSPAEDPASLPVYKNPASTFDFAGARVEDDHTLVLPTLAPVADGRLVLCQGNYLVVKENSDFSPEAATSGPFRLEEFAPGEGCLLTRNEEFAHPELDEAPYLNGLELRSLPDSEARAAALTGGQVDFAHDLSPITARTLRGDERFTVTSTTPPYVSGLFFRMNLAHEPFQDNRVRTAFKLAADREAMVESVFFGDATVGNDLLSPGFPDYADEIEQRAYDPDRARQLLREAGAEGMSVTLTTGPETPGMVEVATLYVENLVAVGVDATLEELPAGQLFADYPAYTGLPLAASFSVPTPALPLYQMSYGGQNPAALGWDRPDVDELVATARGTSGEESAQAGLAAQRALWEEGNTIAPVFKPFTTAQVPGVSGVADDLFEQFPGFSRATLT
ncbi:ABC transporter substrate-binding protein [Streptomyces sp. MP131-18]|uniref:ABC transporter substrate-binding protein n=1 Tax=Streptomyces sp. MP131-18 TaxID=1857892 RepID=UPI00097BFC7D|nr:ABC transporter substrate-binding protein [Streptomyces sp. MP131-18]ONK09528.1 Glutathione-binding protein GsiB precursor [Streptomyces sp. MP131-18]